MSRVIYRRIETASEAVPDSVVEAGITGNLRWK